MYCSCRLRSMVVCFMLCLAALFVLSGCAESPAASVNEAEHPSVQNSGFRNTVLYYVADSDHIVPIMKRIPWEEGIGKAALSCLVATEENASAVREKGLRAIIPEGVDFELTINSDKQATLNIINLPKADSAETEKAMLTTVVNTLLEFPSIDSVTILLDGKAVKALPMGTPVQENMGRMAINTVYDIPTMAWTDSEGANLRPVTVYVPNESCALQIPLTVNEEQVSFEGAVLRMMEMSEEAAFHDCFPEGTVLLSASIENGAAAVNFSREFSEIKEGSSGVFEALYKSLYLTAASIEDVSELNIYIEGESFMPETVSVSAPLYANEW